MEQNDQPTTAKAELDTLKTWPDVLRWLIARNGIGVIFLALLAPVYLDLRTANQQYAALGNANVAAMIDMTNQVKEHRVAAATYQAVETDNIRRIDSTLKEIQDHLKP